MAIHPNLPGIEVTVKVGGQPLFEYATNNEPLPKPMEKRARRKLFHQQKVTITKYIEVVEGKTFLIHVSAKAPYEMDSAKLQFRVFVDGVWIREPIMTKDDYENKDWDDVVEGPCGEVNSGHRPMTFSVVRTTSEKLTKYEVDEHKEKMDGVGEIIVEVHRRTEGRLSKPAKNEITRDFEVSYEEDPVHEKATVLSATSHGTTYGSAVRGANEYDFGVWETATVDGDDFMRAMFVFKYRSKEALKQLLVIPRTPSPEPEPKELELDLCQAVRGKNQDPDPIQEPMQPMQEPGQELVQGPASVEVKLGEATWSAEEKEIMARTLQELRSGKGNLKREREDDGDFKRERLDESNIKKEHLGVADFGGEKSRKKPKKWAGKTIIDLTESDKEPDYILVD